MILVAALLATGSVLGINYFTKRVFDVSLVETLFTWHTALSLLAVPLILGHLYLALLHPSTRESLRGVTRGSVRRNWAERHHNAWTQTPPPEAPPCETQGGSPKQPR